LKAVLTLCLCVFAGEIINLATHIPLPGAVIGLVLLLLYLIFRRGPDDGLRKVSSLLLQNMTVLFVPAGVGLMTQLPALEKDLWPIAVAITVSTILGMFVTASLMHLINKARRSDADA